MATEGGARRRTRRPRPRPGVGRPLGPTATIGPFAVALALAALLSASTSLPALAASTGHGFGFGFGFGRGGSGSGSAHLLQSSVRRYYARPPHDSRLYDVLRVRPDATLVEIQKSWRRLSREWHPDKVALRRRKRRARAQKSTPPPPPPPPPPRAGDVEHRPPPRPPPPPPPPLDVTSSEGSRSNDNENDGEESDDEEYARERLAELADAYETLSDDRARLLYHKYGLVGGTDAATRLLMGNVPSSTEIYELNAMGDNRQLATDFSEEQGRLLELMGYPPKGDSGRHFDPWSLPRRGQHHHPHHHGLHHHRHSHHDHHPRNAQQRRQEYLMATIAERLRPLVEGAVSQDLFVADVFRECRALKKSPLGAQILRCVGRAYRVEGYRVLRSTRSVRGSNGVVTAANGRSGGGVQDHVVDKWRDAKHYAAAALAGGKWALMEQKLKKLEEDREKERRRQRGETRRIRCESGNREGQEGGEEAAKFAFDVGALPDDVPDSSEEDAIGALSDDDELFCLVDADVHNDGHDGRDDELDRELRHVQKKKTYAALLTAHQMEALWKVTKIELDRTVRAACRRMLSSSGEGTESPNSGRRRRRRPRARRADGWVGGTGEAVPTEVGRLRAAAALVLVGDVMVRCSKEGTARDK
ncbi:hypothetical protein ACHAWF_015563 [Thalassiosira exigua]